MTAKETVLYALGTLPDDASMEEIVECVSFVAHVDTRLRHHGDDEGIPQDQAMARIRRTLAEYGEELTLDPEPISGSVE